MATRLSVTEFDAMMKEIYPNIRVRSLAIKNRPFLNWVPKADVFYGDTYVVPVLYEDPQGRSMSLSTAVTNANTSKQEKFVLTDSDRVSDYGVVQIEAEAMKAASKDVGAFIRAKDAQIQGMLRQLGKSLHTGLYRSGTGSIGKISSISTKTVTLTNKSDVHHFGKGQVVVASTADGGGSTKTKTTVDARSVSAGTVTFEDDVTSLASAWAANDFLFTEGDYDAHVTGLAGWIPLTAPTSGDSHFSVDRSTDVTRLAGHRLDESSRTIMENAEELAMFIAEEGGEPDAMFLNPRAGVILAEQVGAKVTRDEGGMARLGFRGFVLEHFLTGPIEVRFDYACPPDRAYMLQRNTWKLIHMDELPHIIRDDGRDSLRSHDGTYDGIEVRSRYWANLTCEAPAWNGVMSVATA